MVKLDWLNDNIKMDNTNLMMINTIELYNL